MELQVKNWKNLVADMQSGDTDPTSAPKVVRVFDPSFLDYKLSIFGWHQLGKGTKPNIFCRVASDTRS